MYQVDHLNSFHPYLLQNHLEETDSQEPEEGKEAKMPPKQT